MSFPTLTSFGGQRRIALDGHNTTWLARARELAAEGTGMNGPEWATAEPTEGGYGSTATIAAKAAASHALGEKFQLNFGAEGAAWAMDFHATDTYADPGTGGTRPKHLNIKVSKESNWEAMIEKIMTEIDPDYLQISSEAENAWSSAAGYARAVSLARARARLIKPGIKIMAPGLNFGNAFVLGTPDPMTDKMTWFREFVEEIGGDLDVVSMHLSHLPEGFAGAVAWVQAEMAAAGWGRPIWCDDMSSGPFYSEGPLGETTPPWSSPDEIALMDGIDSGDPDFILPYETAQARSAVIKPVMAFAAGVQKVFISTPANFAGYWLERWNHQGLMRSVDPYAGMRKPAFYSVQQMIRAIDGFRTAAQLGADTAYKFTFPNKGDVVVAWATAPGTIDLSAVFSGSVRATTVVTQLSGTIPVQPVDYVGSAATVPVDITPVIVAAA